MLADHWRVVEQFEHRMAEYCGAANAIAVDTCTAALFLCLKLLKPVRVTIPHKTYLGVACSIIHSGAELQLRETSWKGQYKLDIWQREPCLIDSACRLHRDMYLPETLTCLSFQYRKHLKVGRGGMILTDYDDDANWLRKARFCGRSVVNGVPEFIGWQAYMEPERAARGLVLMDSLPDKNEDLVFEYPDLREYEVLR